MVNKIQNGNGLRERTDIKKLKLGTKLGKQINNTSLTFEKKRTDRNALPSFTVYE